MALNLLSLLQAAGGIDPQQQQSQPDDSGGDIIVTGRAFHGKQAPSAPIDFPHAPPSPQLSNGDPGPDLGNRSYVEAARAAMANEPPHKGMFGLKGTLRDILGTVGDAFLVQGGGNPLYRQTVDQEKTSDALSGFSANPMAAIERLAQVNPDAAAKLMQTTQTDMTNQGRVGAMKQHYSNMQDTAEAARYKQGATLLSSYLGSATPETYDKIKPILMQIKQRFGLGDEFQIPDKFDPNYSKTMQMGGMPAQQQVYSDYRDKSLDHRIQHDTTMEGIGQQNADAHTTSASRPPAPHYAPQPTAASIAAPLLKTLENGGSLSKGQEEVLRRTGFYPDRGVPKKKFTLPPLPAGFKLK